MKTGVIDTNVLIYLFDELQYDDANKYQKVVAHLYSNFSQIWIPQVVKDEFCITPKREKLMGSIMEEHADFIIDCPINTSKNDRDIHITNIDLGEADALSQMEKAHMLKAKSPKREMFFFSEDRKALEYIEYSGFLTLDYRDFKLQLTEMGVESP